MTDALVLGGVRTPVGRYGGSLSHIRTDDLLGQTMVWACERVGVDLDRIEDIAAGCVNPAHEGMGDIARWGGAGRGLSGLGPGRDGEPLLRVVADLHDPDRARDPRGRARRRPGRRCRVDVTFGLGADEGRRSVHATWPRVHARHDVGGRGRAAEPGAARARRLHRDDADGAERGRPLRADARGDRRVRAALPPARGRRPRFRAARTGDPPGRDSRHPQAARAHLRARREHPRRHDGGEARGAPGSAQHDPDDGRQLLAAERRRERGRARERRGGGRRSAPSRSRAWWRRRPTRSIRSSWGSRRHTRSRRRSSAPG